jgi:glycosyltransferase involved in cell wall biosynthesis
LARHYRYAAALVYPSLYEGFGLPTVEAMTFGCPIVASTGGSIPEIVGPAGVYFDPLSSEMLAETLRNLLFEESAKERLRVLMRERAKRFSWEETARQTLECYRKAAA